MKQRRKTNLIQAELFEGLGLNGSPRLLDLVVGGSLELETAIAELLLNAIDNAEPARGEDHDA
jgi:hypothetical protein